VPGPVLPLIDEVLTALGVADLVDVTVDPSTGALSIARRTCCLAFTLPKPKICTGCCIR
jgi:ferric iron reductase protein FhuF